MREVIDEISNKWGEYIEMYPQEERWEVIAQLLAAEVATERSNSEYLRRLNAIGRPTKYT